MTEEKMMFEHKHTNGFKMLVLDTRWLKADNIFIIFL